MSSPDTTRECSVSVLPAEATFSQIQELVVGSEGDVVIVLQETLEEGRGSVLKEHIAQCREYIAGLLMQERNGKRVYVCEDAPVKKGGHNLIYRATDVLGRGAVCVRKPYEHIPRRNRVAQDLYEMTAKQWQYLVRLLGETPDPTALPGQYREITVQEWLEGERLEDILPELSLDQYMSVLQQVLGGLEAIHQAGLAHRDVKLRNIMYAERANGQGGNIHEAVVIDPDLHRQSGRITDADPQGTPPHPPEVELDSTLPDAQRHVISGKTDMWKFADLLRECFVLPQESGRLSGPHTPFQYRLYALYRSAKEQNPALRPTAHELRLAIIQLWGSLTPQEKEQERQYFSITAGRKQKAASPDYAGHLLQTYRELYPHHLIVEDPQYEAMLGRLQADCGEAMRGSNPWEADLHFEEAGKHFLRYLALDPLSRNVANGVERLAALAATRAGLRLGEEERHEAESQAWDHTAAFLKLPPEQHPAVLRTLALRPQKYLSHMLDALRTWVISSDPGVEEIRAYLEGACPDVLEQYTALDPGVLLRDRVMLYAYMGKIMEEKMVGRFPATTRQEVLAVSHLLLAIDPAPPANFWIIRGEMFQRLAQDGLAEAGGHARQAYERAAAFTHPREEDVCVCAEYFYRQGEHERAVALLQAVPLVRRTSDWFQLMADYQPDPSDAIRTLREGYLLHPSDLQINVALLRQMADETPANLQSLMFHAEKVFAHDRTLAVQLLSRYFETIHKSESVPSLNQEAARELYALWRQWDPTEVPIKTFLFVAHNQGPQWNTFLREVEGDLWGVLPVPAADSGNPATKKLQELRACTSFETAAAFGTKEYLPTLLGERLHSCTIPEVAPAPDQGLPVFLLEHHPVVDAHGRRETARIPIRGPGHAVSWLLVEWKAKPDAVQRDLIDLLFVAECIGAIATRELLQEEKHKQEAYRKELQEVGVQQKQLLLRKYPHAPGYRFGARWEPGKLSLGGDGYFWGQVGTDIFFGIYDVEGHGLKSVPLQVGVHTTLKHQLELACLKGEPGVTPDLAALGRRISDEVGREWCDVTGKFVTAIIGTLDTKTHTVQFVNFGHESPLRVAPDSVSSISAMEKEFAFGIEEMKKNPVPQTLQMRPGERLIFYTDGITDAGVMTGEKLGVRHFAPMCLETLSLDPDTAIMEIMRRVGERECHDDRTIFSIDRVDDGE